MFVEKCVLLVKPSHNCMVMTDSTSTHGSLSQPLPLRENLRWVALEVMCPELIPSGCRYIVLCTFKAPSLQKHA